MKLWVDYPLNVWISLFNFWKQPSETFSPILLFCLTSMPNRIFFSPLSFKTDLATSRFSMYLKKRYSFVLYITCRTQKQNHLNLSANITQNPTNIPYKPTLIFDTSRLFWLKTKISLKVSVLCGCYPYYHLRGQIITAHRKLHNLRFHSMFVAIRAKGVQKPHAHTTNNHNQFS